MLRLGARRWAMLSATLGLLYAAPAVGYDGVLYEAAENIKVTTGKISRRMAVAVLVGTVNAGTPWCPAALGRKTCDVTAVGADNVNLATGTTRWMGRSSPSSAARSTARWTCRPRSSARMVWR
jgi:hypothetical protein